MKAASNRFLPTGENKRSVLAAAALILNQMRKVVSFATTGAEFLRQECAIKIATLLLL